MRFGWYRSNVCVFCNLWAGSLWNLLNKQWISSHGIRQGNGPLASCMGGRPSLSPYEAYHATKRYVRLRSRLRSCGQDNGPSGFLKGGKFIWSLVSIIASHLSVRQYASTIMLTDMRIGRRQSMKLDLQNFLLMKQEKLLKVECRASSNGLYSVTVPWEWRLSLGCRLAVIQLYPLTAKQPLLQYRRS
jgi:hypothetical protein